MCLTGFLSLFEESAKNWNDDDISINSEVITIQDILSCLQMQNVPLRKLYS